MLLDFLFKPKWQSKNPRVRRQALNAMDPGRPETQTLFREALQADPDPVLRQWLVQQVNDLALIADVAVKDADAMVRNQANQRWRKVVAGSDVGPFDLEARLQAIEAQQDLRLLEWIAKEGRDVAVRRAAMLRIDKDAVYGDVACGDPDADLRLEAAEHVRQRSTLERVFKVAKTKDKRVRALVQGRLDGAEAAEQRTPELYRQLRQCCVKLEAELALLESRGNVEQVAEHAERLEAEWAQLYAAWRNASSGNDEDQLAARFERARQSLTEALATARHAQATLHQTELASAAQRSALVDVCGELEAAIDAAVAAPELSATVDATLNAALEAAAQGWSQHGSGEIPEDLAARYRQAVARGEVLRGQIKEYIEGMSKLSEISPRAQQLTSEPDMRLVQEGVTALTQRLQRFAVAGFRPWPAGLLDEARRAVAALQERVSARSQALEHAMAQFKDQVRALQGLLEAGKSKEALEAARMLQQTLDTAEPELVQSLRRQRVYRHFQSAKKALRELRDWQGWATTPLREQLCSEMEELAVEAEQHIGQASYDFNVVARKVRDARNRWHKLGAGEAETADTLWERFNHLCNRAYAPCQAYFDQQAAARRANAHAREALCLKLENYFSERIDGKTASDVDYRAIEALVRETQREWSQIGPVTRQEHTALSERFRAAADRLRSVVQDERERNRTLKERLIKRAEQLVADLQAPKPSVDVQAATAQVRALRDEWKTIAPAAGERELWLRFRAACDQIFLKRQADFDFKAQALRANLAQRASFCQMLENLADLDGEEIKAARSRVQQMQREWDSLGSVPKTEHDAIQRRFRDAVLRFEERYVQALAEERRAARDALARRGDLCAGVEFQADALLHGGRVDTVALDELRRQWETLPALSHRQDRLLNERWERAWERLAKLADPGARQDALADWLRTKATQAKHKQRLCVRAEILAGIESPAEARDERLALQVAQLADKMGRQQEAPAGKRSEEFDELLVQWYAAPITEAETERSLGARFARACAAAGHARTGYSAVLP